MILYFSATGNGKYISEEIAEKTNETCMSIVDCIRGDKYVFSGETIFGIVVPTYFWRLPRIVAEYLDKLRIENCGYTFFLASYGTTTGKAGSMAKDIMAHHGQKFDAYYSVIMPDTWTPVFDLTDKERVDVFTDVRNLQSVMATGKRTDMDSIKIRIPEFRKIWSLCTGHRKYCRCSFRWNSFHRCHRQNSYHSRYVSMRFQDRSFLEPQM